MNLAGAERNEKVPARKGIFAMKKGSVNINGCCPHSEKALKISEAEHEHKGGGQSLHPDHSANLNRIQRMKGQLDGIGKMISERRYCVDIVTQIRAVRQALRALEGQILEKHLHHCVHGAVTSGNKAESNRKIEEIIGLLKFNS